MRRANSPKESRIDGECWLNFHISKPRVREDVQGCDGLQVQPSKEDCASRGPDECPDQLGNVIRSDRFEVMGYAWYSCAVC